MSSTGTVVQRKVTLGTKAIVYIVLLFLAIVTTGVVFAIPSNFETNTLLAEKAIAMANSAKQFMGKS